MHNEHRWVNEKNIQIQFDGYFDVYFKKMSILVLIQMINNSDW